MKAVILAGGVGSRLSEETMLKPKPMVEIGGKPILWHIMKIYSCHGVTEFIVCTGYKGHVIKEYFANYFLHSSDVTFDLAKKTIEFHRSIAESWRVTLVDTGDGTMTGGRLRRVLPYVQNEEMFCMTYGDGVADINIPELIDFHKRSGKIATLTAMQPQGRFGALRIAGNGTVCSFAEKPKGDAGWVNGGFFVLSPRVGDYLIDDTTVWERDPLENISKRGELAAYKHFGYWQPMDTLRDKVTLETLWNRGEAPWRIWE
ncbi:MAG TPA: glucose-1-phosphate cytidylyltransferase [Bryobacteraceae bacterium]|jgi:glucose-1-phosphate cytidylyltransferase|nr:glucose-1-phosphate cytidylyltransferase [Bryobacteraceae bacterium]